LDISNIKSESEIRETSLDVSNPCDNFIIASETCAIDAVNGQFLRDVEPGEIVVISKDGIHSIKYADENKRTCIFEYVYFARPDSVIDGISVQEARYEMGKVLAQESPVEADVVIGVPDSGLGAAQGYARASGIPYGMGIIKNKYIGRTFIAPTQAERENMVFVKLNAIRSDLEGKRVIVIDDSIVRGTTSRRLVQILRRAGAKEVHFRVSSPPVKFPCHLGIDTPSKAELISSTHELEAIRKEIGSDSLAFISLDGMKRALSSCCPEKEKCCDEWCEGCFNGEYPV
ncbi:MAG: amidophosphoribosyltransferase, partial [Treponema sp.]|nr:amidophosphoribosyltransferase [Treponema sp.]